MFISLQLVLAVASQEISGEGSVWLLEESHPKNLSIVERSLPDLTAKSQTKLNTSFLDSLDDVLGFRYYPSQGAALLLCSSDKISDPVKLLLVNRQGEPLHLPAVPEWFFYGLSFQKHRPAMLAYNYESRSWAEFIWLKSGWSDPRIVDAAKVEKSSLRQKFLKTGQDAFSTAIRLGISIPSSQAGLTFSWDRVFDPYYSVGAFSVSDQSFLIKEIDGQGLRLFVVGSDHQTFRTINLNLGSGIRCLTKFDGKFGLVTADNRFWLFSDAGQFLGSIPNVRFIADAF